MEKQIIITTSWDDGSPKDIKLAKLLKKYNMPATFYIPIKNIESRYTLTERGVISLRKMGFQIGAHTFSHPYLMKLPLGQIEKEIRSGKTVLEEYLGEKVTTFAYPHGDYNPEILSLLKRLNFEYARTIRILQFEVNNLLTAPTSNHAANHPSVHYFKELFLAKNINYSSYFFKNQIWKYSWDGQAIKNLDYVLKNGGIWHLWGHSEEIDCYSQWTQLERVLSKVSKLRNGKDVFFCDNLDSAKHYLNN